MKLFFEKLNQKANIGSILSIIFTVISTGISIAVSLNLKIAILAIYSLVGVAIVIIIGFKLFVKKMIVPVFAEEMSTDKEVSYGIVRGLLKGLLSYLLSLTIIVGLIFGFIAIVENLNIALNFLKTNWIAIAIIVAGLIFLLSIIQGISLLVATYRKYRYGGASAVAGGGISRDENEDENEDKNQNVDNYAERKTFIDITELEKIFEEYVKKLHNVSEKNSVPKDIISHMLSDTEETTEYFKISKNDARKSFCMSIILSAFGFLLIVFAVIWGIVSQNITPAIISSIGGVVTDVIAGTAFFIRKQSLTQLNHYFDKLSRNQDILVSVKMVEQMSKNKRDDMYQEIIKNALNNTYSSK